MTWGSMIDSVKNFFRPVPPLYLQEYLKLKEKEHEGIRREIGRIDEAIQEQTKIVDKAEARLLRLQAEADAPQAGRKDE